MFFNDRYEEGYKDAKSIADESIKTLLKEIHISNCCTNTIVSTQIQSHAQKIERVTCKQCNKIILFIDNIEASSSGTALFEDYVKEKQEQDGKKN